MRKVILLGGGGFAREVLETIEEGNKHADRRIEPLGFVYDGGDKEKGKLIHDLPVLGDLSYLKSIDFNEISLVPAIGRSIWRKKLVQESKKLGASFISVIHPSTHISKWAKIGEGAIIQSQCIIMPEIEIGDFFVSNDNVSIGHDTVIGDFVHVNPNVNIAGGTKIGNDVFIGVKATILTCTIGEGSIIGACGLVTKNVPPNVVAKGIPARYFEIKEKEY